MRSESQKSGAASTASTGMKRPKLAHDSLARWCTAFLIAFVGAAVFVPSGCTSRTPSGRTLIRYAQWSGIQHQPVVWKLKKEFEKLHPDIEVKLEFYPRIYWSKILTSLAGGVAPDVIYLSPPYVPDLVRKGTLLHLDPLIERDIPDMEDFYDVSVNSFRVDGRLYGLSMQYGCIALYYNKRLFDAAKVPYPADDWTWDNLLNTAKKLTLDHDGDGTTDQYGFMVSTSFEVCVANFIWQNGGRILNEDKSRALLDRPEAIEAIRFLKDLIFKHHVCPKIDLSETVGMDTLQLFEAGLVAMIFDGSWKMDHYNRTRELDYDVAPLPYRKRRMVAVNGLANGITARTRHPEEAWKWVKFYTSPMAQRILGKMKRGIPVRMSVARSDAFLNPDAPPENERVFLNQTKYGHDLFPTPAYLEWANVYSREADLVFRDMKSARRGMTDATKEINKILARVLEEP